MHSSDVLPSLGEGKGATPGSSLSVPCRICGGSRREVLAIETRRVLYRCTECGTSFVHPQPGDGELTEHFQEETNHGHSFRLQTSRESVLARVARCIEDRKPLGGIILDVGCATGFFLSRFFRAPQWRLCGVELSRHRAEIAAQQGVQVYCGDIHQAQLADGSIDVITVLDTFYYFADPQRELLEFERILKKDGLLLLELPSASWRIWRLTHSRSASNGNSLLARSDHLFYYTPRSISRLLERCGLEVQAIVPLPANRQDTWMRNALYRALCLLAQALRLLFGSHTLSPRFAVIARKAATDGLPSKG